MLKGRKLLGKLELDFSRLGSTHSRGSGSRGRRSMKGCRCFGKKGPGARGRRAPEEMERERLERQGQMNLLELIEALKRNGTPGR